MTDGIIQQVFKSFYQHMGSFNGYVNLNSNEILGLYQQLEQELIEKIKQECYTTGQTTAYRYKVRDWITLEQLIGDNQE